MSSLITTKVPLCCSLGKLNQAEISPQWDRVVTVQLWPETGHLIKDKQKHSDF